MGFDKNRRALFTPQVRTGSHRYDAVTAATSPQTLTGPGVFALDSSSTTVAAVDTFTLDTPQFLGDVVELSAVAVGATSVGMRISASSSDTTFDGTLDSITFSTEGSGMRLVAQSSSRWLITGARNATLAAST